MLLVVPQADPRARLIEAMLNRNGLSYRWLAERIDASHPTVSSWLSGSSRPRDRAVWDRMLSVLREYEQSAKSHTKMPLHKLGMRQILVYPGLAAGPYGSAVADVDTMDVPDWGTDRERWGRVVEGFSMSPLLEPGDVVVVEDRPAEPSHVVEAEKDGGCTVKVFKNVDGMPMLLPTNQDYLPCPVDGAVIKGVVVMRIRFGPEGEKTTTEYPHGMRYRA